MKDLLVLAYDFPPSSVGIWRTVKFCRYLPEFGWRPHILTVHPVRAPRQDEGPLRELPPGTEIRRTESLDPARLAWLWAQRRTAPKQGLSAPSLPATHVRGRAVLDVLRRWIFIPDERMFWFPFALAAGRRWLQERRFDALYTTSFPHTAHVVGALLSREFDVPLLADFRDSWTGNYEFYRPATRLHDALQRRLEARVVTMARAVVTATDPITEDFRRRFPTLGAEHFRTITNGFDEGDYSPHDARPDRSAFTITYAGTLFGDATPRPFFQAVAEHLATCPADRAVLRLRFAGSMIEPYRALIDTFGLGDVTRVDPYLPHGEALQLMSEADMLLLLVPDRPGAEIMLTQKVFEYAAARRPILGLVPQGAARAFLMELGEGPILPPGDVAGIRQAIAETLMQWRTNGRRELPPNPVLENYRRRTLTAKLSRCLDDMISSSS